MYLVGSFLCAPWWCLKRSSIEEVMKPDLESKPGGRDVPRWMWWCLAIVVVSAVVVIWRPLQPTVEQQFQDAVVAVERGEIAKAREIHKRLTQRGALDEARVLQGGILTRMSEWQAALGFLEASLAHGHLRRPLLMWAGQCLLGIHDLGRAEFVLRLLVNECPEESKAIRMLAVTYYDLGAMHPALDCLKQLQKLESDDYRPHHLSGVIYLDFEQFAEAINALTEALARQPPEAKRAEISEDLALAHIKLLQFSKALNRLESLPDSPRGLALQALCHLAEGNEADAKISVSLGKKLLASSGGTEPSLLKAESQLLGHQGKHEEALAVLQRLAALEPHNLESHHEISLVLGRLGRTVEQAAAITKTEKIRELRKELTELSNRANASPYDFEVRIQLAGVCEELGLDGLALSWRQAAQAIKDSEKWRAGTGSTDEL